MIYVFFFLGTYICTTSTLASGSPGVALNNSIYHLFSRLDLDWSPLGHVILLWMQAVKHYSERCFLLHLVVSY